MMSGSRPYSNRRLYIYRCIACTAQFQVECVCDCLAFADTVVENMNGTEDERWVTAREN